MASGVNLNERSYSITKTRIIEDSKTIIYWEIINGHREASIDHRES